MTKNIHFVVDKTFKTKNLKKNILKKFEHFPITKANIIVVIGGDGFMLQILKKYQKYNLPFYGINRGTFGFLMNNSNLNHIKKNLIKAKTFSISPLEMQATTKKNVIKKAIAINEISLLRQSRQTASLQIFKGKNILIKKLVCDGVLISTPAGSTAYNLSVNGPILSLDSKKLAVTPISPFRPRRWKGKIISSSSLIKVNNLNTKKRPVSVVADNFEVRNVKNVKIKINKSIKFKLLYDQKSNLNKKIKLEESKRNKSAKK